MEGFCQENDDKNGINIAAPGRNESFWFIKWIYDFLDSAIAEKKRVDFICVHMYVGTDDKGFVQTLQDLYNKYHLPIWVTEFATADWNAAATSANAYPPDQVLAFMQRLLQNWIRCLLFNGIPGFPGIRKAPTSGLLRSSMPAGI